MENKYYTPSLEEFHVGFEYEFKHSDYPESNWVKYSTPVTNSDLENCPFNNVEFSEYRVKYLDKEDIENLGFKCTETFCPFMGTKLECKLNVEVGFNTGKNVTIEFWEKRPFQIYIKTEIYSSYGNPVDTGRYIIKNKTELKKLLKQKEICK